MVELHFSSHTKAILEDYRQAAVTEKVLAEKYTEMITPQVNGHIEHILMEDKDASNVLLLNYHNTLQSTHGLSYRYLTALTEKRREMKLYHQECKHYNDYRLNTRTPTVNPPVHLF